MCQILYSNICQLLNTFRHVLRIKYLNSAVETQTAFANFADDWHDRVIIHWLVWQECYYEFTLN